MFFQQDCRSRLLDPPGSRIDERKRVIRATTRQRPLWHRLAPVAIALTASTVQADPHGFQGTFLKDDDQAVFSLTLSNATTLTAQTFSWGGGTNLAGQLEPAGGFAPVISLFDGAGVLLQLAVGSTGVCGAGAGTADPASGACWDARMTLPISAGSYTLILTQDDNQPYGPTLLDGFTRTGQPNYTGAYIGSAAANFIDVSGLQRTGRWSLALDGTAIVVSQVPEPASSALWLAALAAAFLYSRKDQK